PGRRRGEQLLWQQQSTEPGGLLNLRAVFNRDHISAYALTYVFSPESQKAQMLVGSDDTVRVWLNGALVHEFSTPRSAKPDEDHVAVQLKEGWNMILVKVVNRDFDHGFYLRFTGAHGIRMALTPQR